VRAEFLAGEIVREFIAYCNENKGKVTYASSGNGTRCI